MKNQKCTLRFKETKKLDPSDIADFLFLIRATYAAALNAGGWEEATTIEAAQGLARRSREYLASLSVKEVDRLFYRDLGNYPLTTERISYESPLEIVFAGVTIAIAVAVIISGGKFNAMNMIQAELPPLGDGIKKLRVAVARPTKSRIAFGVRSRKVKLSKEERAELKRVPRSHRGHGGFQRRLVSFQDRIDQKGELELNESDIDFIIRHGRQSYKGGFQARIRKIFGRHFDLADDS